MAVQKEKPDAISPDYQKVFEALPGRYLILTDDHKVCAASAGWLAGAGVALADIAGKNAADVVPDGGFSAERCTPVSGGAHLLWDGTEKEIADMAFGIGHDLNNLFAPITLSASLLVTMVEDEDALRVLENLRESVKQGAQTARELLEFSESGEGDAKQLLSIVKKASQ